MFKPFARVLKNRILVTCFATAMVFFSMTVFSVPTPNTVAANTVITETYDYTDKTYTVQCGYKYVGCRGQVAQTGCVTVWKIVYTEPCSL